MDQPTDNQLPSSSSSPDASPSTSPSVERPAAGRTFVRRPSRLNRVYSNITPDSPALSTYDESTTLLPAAHPPSQPPSNPPPHTPAAADTPALPTAELPAGLERLSSASHPLYDPSPLLYTSYNVHPSHHIPQAQHWQLCTQPRPPIHRAQQQQKHCQQRHHIQPSACPLLPPTQPRCIFQRECDGGTSSGSCSQGPQAPWALQSE